MSIEPGAIVMRNGRYGYQARIVRGDYAAKQEFTGNHYPSSIKKEVFFMTNKLSPCGYCTRVPDPRECENKNCMLWRKWYIERWEAMRTAVRVRMDMPPQPVGVCISGTHYAAPHQVTAYLDADPCAACLCPRQLCTTPCRARSDWDKARREVLP